MTTSDQIVPVNETTGRRDHDLDSHSTRWATDPELTSPGNTEPPRQGGNKLNGAGGPPPTAEQPQADNRHSYQGSGEVAGA